MLTLPPGHRGPQVGVGPAGTLGAMSPEDEAPDRPQDDEARRTEAVWTPPQRSDQAPGEEVVQVNDAYTGGQEPPADESHRDDDQHPTGG